MSIKKPYVELIEFLTANENKKVSTILEQVREMCESQKSTSTVLRDKDDNIIAIFCYYHKQWELVKDIPYGKKANTQTGLNTMCKVGVSKWTKAQKVAKDSKEELLEKVSIGEIEIGDIQKHQRDIEVQRVTIDTTDMPIGYSSEQEAIDAYLLSSEAEEVVSE